MMKSACIPNDCASCAVIDIGTVSVRLALASYQDGEVIFHHREARICNLGEGVSATRELCPAAMQRVLSCILDYLAITRNWGIHTVCCLLTSAARDARNSQNFLYDLKGLGVVPEVIEGNLEAQLSFYGVAHNFVNQEIISVDNGGGSTEFTYGILHDKSVFQDAYTDVSNTRTQNLHKSYQLKEQMDIRSLCSVDIGCRRISETFNLSDGPYSISDYLPAKIYIQQHLEDAKDHYFKALQPQHTPAGLLQQQEQCHMVLTGGTATSLVAIHKKLDPYDPERVHLSSLGKNEVRSLVNLLASSTKSQLNNLIGLQAKRSDVIFAGALIIDEIMDCFGMNKIIISEDDILLGICAIIGKHTNGEELPFMWEPHLSVV